MDRRALLHAGALTGIAATTGRAERPPEPPLPRPGPASDMDAYVARVDAGLKRIGAWSLAEQFPGATINADTDTLARTAMRSLFVTGMLGDLPAEQQRHAGMQERVWAAVPEMDEALERMSTFITTRSSEELARVQAALNDPAFLDTMSDALDREAEQTGVSAWRRQQVRSSLRLAAWRLAHQPPELMIAEYAGKIERVDASDIAREARGRFLTGRTGERLFWDRADNAGGMVNADDVTAQARTTRERRIARGVKAMGIGILIFGAGALLVTAGDNNSGENDTAIGLGLITGTVGVIWFLVGLIILMVGLATPVSSGAAAAPVTPPR